MHTFSRSPSLEPLSHSENDRDLPLDSTPMQNVIPDFLPAASLGILIFVTDTALIASTHRAGHPLAAWSDRQHTSPDRIRCYALVTPTLGGGIRVRGSGRMGGGMAALHARFRSDFAWFELESRYYVIRNKDVLRRLRGVFLPVTEIETSRDRVKEDLTRLEARRDLLDDERETHREQFAALDRELKSQVASIPRTEKLAARYDVARTAVVRSEARIKGLERELKKFAIKRDELGQRQIEAEEKAERQLRSLLVECITTGEAASTD